MLPVKPVVKLKEPFAFATCLLLSAVSFTGCTAYQIAGHVQKGRAELMIGDPKVALGHFQRAAESAPNYLVDFSPLPQGVWTYIGRAYYALGDFSQARQALERARSEHPDDHLAKIYLGLALAGGGDRQGGLKEIEGGLTGLYQWLNAIERAHPHRDFWDPAKRIRDEIREDLAMMSGEDIDWKTLIASGEWIGKRIEQEIDHVRQDKFDELYRNNGDGGGMN